MADLEIIEQFLNIDVDGKLLRNGKKKSNKNRFYYFRNQFYVVELSRDKWMVASDDDNTRRLLRDHVWCVNPKGYSVTSIKRNGKYTTERFHRLIINAQDTGDHINNRPYDNQCTNLRDTTQRENCKNRIKARNNTSGKQGVCRDTINGRHYWKVQIKDDTGKQISKYFSIAKLGDAGAKRRAIDKRIELEQLYNYLGD